MLDRKSKQVLKKLIEIHDETSEVTISYDKYKDDLLNLYKKSKKPYQNLVSSFESLESNNLVKVLRADTYSGKVVVDISLLKEGINYFKFNRKISRNYWIPIIISNLMSAAAILISIIALNK